MSRENESVEDAELEAIMAELEAQSAAYSATENTAGAEQAKEAPTELGEEREESPIPPPEAFKHDDDVVYESPVEEESERSERPAVEAEPVSAPEAEAVEAVEEHVVTTLDTVAEASKLEEKKAAEKRAATVSQIKADAKAKTALKYIIDPAEFNRETGVNETDLDRCMVEQSALRAFYGAQAAYAEGQHSTMKVKFDVLEAALYDHHRKEFAADPAIKVTEKMVENAVKADPRWLKGKSAVIEAETIANVNKALSISLGDRKDMLVQLGADRREEGKGAMRMMEAKAADAGKRALGR